MSKMWVSKKSPGSDVSPQPTAGSADSPRVSARARAFAVLGVFLLGGFALIATTLQLPDVPDGPPTSEQILRGRYLVITHGCGDCHGGFDDPGAEGWLAGWRPPRQEFMVGPFTTRARNITPDNTTGIGRFSERQLFNAIRFGLRPGETPDVEITSTTPGEGNFPALPKYLAPPMPWPAFRHMSDQEIWDMVAYLKHAVKPAVNRVADSEGPPDFWAEFYATEFTGTVPPRDFPTPNERALE